MVRDTGFVAIKFSFVLPDQNKSFVTTLHNHPSQVYCKQIKNHQHP